MPAMPIVLKSVTSAELYDRLAGLGLTLRQAEKLHATVIRRGALPGADEGIKATLLDEVRRRTVIPNLTLVDKRVSPQDGFTKYLFRGEGPEPFEAVRIPLLHRPEDRKYVVCVSSQVGCAMGCAFCATGRLGFRRNLAAWEIVDQVIQVRADSPYPVRGVVFMGMGEPMLNYENVLQAARFFRQSCGLAIGGKAITISTVGIVPAIRRFTAERHNYRLVVSLNSADPRQRRQWMPVEGAYSTAELIESLRAYHEVTRRRVILAWTMMAGLNTRDEDAQMLADLTRGLPITVNLIDVNDPTGRFRPPSPAERGAFRDALSARLAAPVVYRYSGGRDIHAACGMLAGESAQPLPDACVQSRNSPSSSRSGT